eukprot:SAG11_NODE_29975_length_305_cov_0.995146_1_plen_45_part_01
MGLRCSSLAGCVQVRLVKTAKSSWAVYKVGDKVEVQLPAAGMPVP